jgi:hypothetical protein
VKNVKVGGAARIRQIAIVLVLFVAASPSLLLAETFGSVQLVANVSVQRIFSGQGTTFVTFSSLPGCPTNGGYITVSWPAANNGVLDENRTKQIVATLLFAKARETLMEVRYRINNAPTGWDGCTIDAVFLN